MENCRKPIAKRLKLNLKIYGERWLHNTGRRGKASSNKRNSCCPSTLNPSSLNTLYSTFTPAAPYASPTGVLPPVRPDASAGQTGIVPPVRRGALSVRPFPTTFVGSAPVPAVPTYPMASSYVPKQALTPFVVFAPNPPFVAPQNSASQQGVLPNPVVNVT
uniref:Uncharacterized protein n=1 Tax=Oryza punctata TaxID=4537 RepID=A0A0E0JPP2_ORYPU